MTGSEFLAALLVGLIPSILWLFFWLREDATHSEPRSLLAGCFLAGMLAVAIAIPVEQFLATLAHSDSQKYIFWAATEEILKFVAVACAALMTRYNDEPIDAMIYSIAVALGFAALENTLFVMSPLSHGSLAASLIHGNLRSIGATLVHIVSSATIGFALGISFYRGRFAKFFGWMVALGLAIALHAAFNISVANANGTDTLKSFGWIWGAVVVMIILFEEVKAVRPRLVS